MSYLQHFGFFSGPQLPRQLPYKNWLGASGPNCHLTTKLGHLNPKLHLNPRYNPEYPYFLQYSFFSSIKFPAHGILHLMGNAWVFPSLSHSITASTASDNVLSQILRKGEDQKKMSTWGDLPKIFGYWGGGFLCSLSEKTI